MAHPLDEIPLQPPHSSTDSAEFLVYGIVEQEVGEIERTKWDVTRGEFVRTGLIMRELLPAPYGWIPQTLCEADDAALDVIILTEAKLPQGHYLPVRPVGILLRRDQDHKILAVDIADARYGNVKDYSELPGELLTLIEDWFRPYFELDGWADAPSARQMIEVAHTAFLAEARTL